MYSLCKVLSYLLFVCPLLVFFIYAYPSNRTFILYFASYFGCNILLFFIYHIILRCRKNFQVRKICKTVLYNEIQDVDIQLNTECIICLHTFDPKEKVTLLECGCLYLFHQHCIKEWFKNDMSCPFCRKKFDDSDPPTIL